MLPAKSEGAAAIIGRVTSGQETTAQRTAAAEEAARSGCLVVEHESPGVIDLGGATALDLLQRMSTNDVIGLEVASRRGTVLTTAIGRTVDVVDVLRRPSEIRLLTSPNRAATVREWLGRHIFFQDDVQFGDVGGPFTFLGLYGPAAAREIGRIAGRLPGDEGAFVEGSDWLAWPTSRPVPGYRLLAGPQTAERARSLWAEAHPAEESARSAFEAIRIAHGFPVFGREIDDEVIPLEVGLAHLVSFTKGCYIGQEVIARMDSRGRTARRLAGVRLARLEQPPQDLLVAGQAVGRLTSAVDSPRLGPIGLALVRTASLESLPAEALLASGGRAVLQELPFGDQPD